MKALVDTGFYLACSQRGSRTPRYLAALLSAASRLRIDLCVPYLVFCECLSHVSNIALERPHSAWEYSAEVQFFRRLFQHVRVLPGLNVSEMLAAAAARRRVIRALSGSHERELPSLADAALAFSASTDADVVLVVTDDAQDFWQLAPDFHGAVETIQSLLQRVGL